MNMKPTNNSVKYEVLVKHYLPAFLEISAKITRFSARRLNKRSKGTFLAGRITIYAPWFSPAQAFWLEMAQTSV